MPNNEERTIEETMMVSGEPHIIEIIVRTTNPEGIETDTPIMGVEGAIILAKLRGSDAQTMVLGDSDTILDIGARAHGLIEHALTQMFGDIPKES